MAKNLVKIIMGSGKDFEFCQKIGEALGEFKIPYQYRVASAHKTPKRVLEILKEDRGDLNLIYITVAGRSNALSGFIDANSQRPVIACPPYSEKFAGVDIFSSLRMPSGSGLVTVLEPEAAALMAIKILALTNRALAKKIKLVQGKLKKKVYQSDKEVKKYGQR
jgi:phosphoribosylaminoimidazole carboxylase PurE protein